MSRPIFKISLLVIFVFVPLILSGCGEKLASRKKPDVLAEINKFKLTTEDFEREARLVGSNGYPPEEAARLKSQILDNLIMKKILVQEAQAQDFDKDRAFLKEIESYWEQALLKLLIKQKTQEFAGNVSVSEDEIEAEYKTVYYPKDQALDASLRKTIIQDIKRGKIQKQLREWLDLLRSRANVRVDHRGLDKIDISKF